jgi:hypothetical protein
VAASLDNPNLSLHFIVTNAQFFLAIWADKVAIFFRSPREPIWRLVWCSVRWCWRIRHSWRSESQVEAHHVEIQQRRGEAPKDSASRARRSPRRHDGITSKAGGCSIHSSGEPFDSCLEVRELIAASEVGSGHSVQNTSHFFISSSLYLFLW